MNPGLHGKKIIINGASCGDGRAALELIAAASCITGTDLVIDGGDTKHAQFQDGP